ncbi:hypothetical protein OG805_33880 [Streptomyces cellulosae]|nr:hypothetical protein OG805_00040 [Streptomyces cellulosae]WSB95243.1 hypothetical protein OG805_33880 [Streptomyces cellulosae]
MRAGAGVVGQHHQQHRVRLSRHVSVMQWLALYHLTAASREHDQARREARQTSERIRP